MNSIKDYRIKNKKEKIKFGNMEDKICNIFKINNFKNLKKATIKNKKN